MNWPEFTHSPQNHKEPQSGVMMIILQRDIRPQPVFSLLMSGQTFDPIDFGYAMIDGKAQREGSIYLSQDMYKIKCWCEQHGLTYSFDCIAKTPDSPFLDGEYLQVCGDFTNDAIESFPMHYSYMYIRGDK